MTGAATTSTWTRWSGSAYSDWLCFSAQLTAHPSHDDLEWVVREADDYNDEHQHGECSDKQRASYQ